MARPVREELFFAASLKETLEKNWFFFTFCQRRILIVYLLDLRGKGKNGERKLRKVSQK